MILYHVIPVHAAIQQLPESKALDSDSRRNDGGEGSGDLLVNSKTLGWARLEPVKLSRRGWVVSSGRE